MKNLTKALGIIGLVGASFLPMKNAMGQNNLKEYNKENRQVYRDLATLALQKGKLSKEFKALAQVYKIYNRDTTEIISVCLKNYKDLSLIIQTPGKTIIYYDKNSNGLDIMKSVDLNTMMECSSSKLASFFQTGGKNFLYNQAKEYTAISKDILKQ